MWVKLSLPLGVVRLEEIEVHVPLVPDHLRRHKSEEQKKEKLGTIEEY